MSVTEREITGKISKRTVAIQEYRDLISRALLHVIRTEVENEYYLDILQFLDAKPHPTPAQKALVDVLTLLIEDLRRATLCAQVCQPH